MHNYSRLAILELHFSSLPPLLTSRNWLMPFLLVECSFAPFPLTQKLLTASIIIQTSVPSQSQTLIFPKDDTFLKSSLTLLMLTIPWSPVEFLCPVLNIGYFYLHLMPLKIYLFHKDRKCALAMWSWQHCMCWATRQMSVHWRRFRTESIHKWATRKKQTNLSWKLSLLPPSAQSLQLPLCAEIMSSWVTVSKT